MANDCLRSKHVESSCPGNLFFQDRFFVGFLMNARKDG